MSLVYDLVMYMLHDFIMFCVPVWEKQKGASDRERNTLLSISGKKEVGSASTPVEVIITLIGLSIEHDSPLQ